MSLEFVLGSVLCEYSWVEREWFAIAEVLWEGRAWARKLVAA